MASPTTPCPSCGADNLPGSRFCSGCAQPLGSASQAPTAAPPPHATPSRVGAAGSSARGSGGRFPPGAVLAGRYRILDLLGRGGMGEVYHAHDEKLDQEVALKFLPEAIADPAVLDRFHAEVRIARQISHPSVCRVYDMGEIEGTPFISMEYVDGEDLRSLLRRIGRFPGDKALEIARRLCAGLAAAHGTGVLHRDLKPANIMIDGEGRVRIMDFGLAAVATEIAGADVRSGTPAYMAPEQADGRGVSTRSDIYSLGMVLFEMFTGRRAFDESSDRSEVPSTSGIVGDVDPAVETVIRRCLDPNPARRPASALDVARALPGGDPLAEALAAGDTPSPEMVAASDDTGTLSIRTAIACLGLVGAGLVVVLLMSPWTELLSMVPAPSSPEILARRAREILEDLGYADPPGDSAYGFQANGLLGSPMSNWLQEHLDPREVRALLASGRSNAIGFWYRQSPRELVPANPRSLVTPFDPPRSLSGMAVVTLDLEGRLRGFVAIPPQVDSTPAPAGAVDWQPMFDAAGLDRAGWPPVAPEYVPLFGFDERAAWTGVFPEAPVMEMRIEAAAWRGRPVFFQFNDPWFTPTRQVATQRTLGERAANWALTAVMVAVTIGAVLLAWSNFRRGRGDLRAAVRLAAFAVIVWLAQWFLRAHHVSFSAELSKLSWALAEALFYGSLFLVLYLALEPYVRRRWPQSLISWRRLLDGDWRDPVVGGHVLVGTALGVGFAILFDVPTRLGVEAGILPTETPLMARALEGTGATIALPLDYLVSGAIPLALGAFFLYFLLRVLLRRTWIAVCVIVAVPVLGTVGRVFSAVQTPAEAYAAALVAGGVIGLAYGGLIWILQRFGVLPFVVAALVQFTLRFLPVIPEFSAWYSQATIMALLFVVGLAAASFYVALGGRTVLREDFLDA